METAQTVWGPVAIGQPLTGLHVRWLIRRDMEEILSISSCVAHGWCEDEFLRVLRQRNCIGMVCEHNAGNDAFPVIGFMVYELHKHHILVTNFAVNPDYLGRGVGRKMIEKLQGKLASHRRARLAFNARETNLELQTFLRHVGFRAMRLDRAAFDDTGEDSVRMEYRLDDEGR